MINKIIRELLENFVTKELQSADIRYKSIYNNIVKNKKNLDPKYVFWNKNEYLAI